MEKEHTASQYLLGLLIARGQGVRPDPEKAVELFRKAAVMGNKDAQYDLGRALQTCGRPSSGLNVRP